MLLQDLLHIYYVLPFPCSSVGKDSPAMQETWVWFLGREDPLEKEMATHFSTLAWKIPWSEEPGGLQSMGSQESDMTEQLSTVHTHRHRHTHTHTWVCVCVCVYKMYLSRYTHICVYMCVCVYIYIMYLSRYLVPKRVYMLSCNWLFLSPCTVAHQALLPMEFSRQEYQSRVPFPTLGDIPVSRIKHVSLAPPALADRFFTTTATLEAQRVHM